jgi:hypothetical protein
MRIWATISFSNWTQLHGFKFNYAWAIGLYGIVLSVYVNSGKSPKHCHAGQNDDWYPLFILSSICGFAWLIDGYGLMAGLIAHLYNLLLQFTDHYMTHYVFSSPSSSTAASRNSLNYYLSWPYIIVYSLRADPTENSVSIVIARFLLAYSLSRETVYWVVV